LSICWCPGDRHQHIYKEEYGNAVPSRRIRALIVLAIAAVLAAAGMGFLPTGAQPTPPEFAAGPSNATVTIFGRAGSFGALGDTTASGQSLALRPVRGWSIPAGFSLGTPVLASDGSLIMPADSQDVDLANPTARALAFATYDPAGSAFDLVTIDRTSTGLAPSIADLEPIGHEVAFSVEAAPSAATDVRWPAFGVLSKVDGRWQVAAGPGWRNAWTAADLGLDAGGFGAMVRLPASNDVLLVRSFGDGRPGAELVTVRLTGPDGAGRLHAGLVGQFTYDTGALSVRAGHIAADPTGSRGAERFAISWTPYNQGLPEGVFDPPVLQEFTYDADHGSLSVASAPMVPAGELTGPNRLGYGAVHYDRLGDLWAARLLLFGAGDLGVFTQERCPVVPGRPVAAYRTRTADRMTWGATCDPDYDVGQARSLQSAVGIAEDPVTGNLAQVSLLGHLMTMQVARDGDKLGLQIGNLVDIGSILLPRIAGQWLDEMPGPVDGGHRLWIVVRQKQVPPVKAVPQAPVMDQWLVAVDIADTFAPSPVDVSGTPGDDTIVQAERTMNFGTSESTFLRTNVYVDSDTFVAPCLTYPNTSGCGYDGTPGAGFVLNASHGLGHQYGPVDYRIRVHTAGNYRVGFRAFTFGTATFDLIVGDRSYRMSFGTKSGLSMIWLSQLVHLDAGEQTVRLETPAGAGGGWVLNSFVLRRA
jgi:hypothetical protein